MYYSRRYGLQPADRIIEPIFETGLSKHHAIYLGMDRFGVEWVSENFKFYGVRQIKASEFFSDGKNYRVQPFKGNDFERKSAVNRALCKLGTPYDLFSFNCEHYASYVQTGKEESIQVTNALGILFFTFLFGLALSNQK
jgi:hypothetical protein